MSDDLLRLSGVVAGYGGGDVLQGVEIGVPRGSVACIVGPNGAGKSTVLKTISGLLTPRRGEIHLDGERIDNRPPPTSWAAASPRCRSPTRSSPT